MKKIAAILLSLFLALVFSGCKFIPGGDDPAVEPDKTEEEELSDLKNKIDELSGDEDDEDEDEDEDDDEDDEDEEDEDEDEDEDDEDEDEDEDEDDDSDAEPEKEVEIVPTYQGDSFITLDSPSDGYTFSVEPMEFEGEVSPNTTKIVVEADGGSDIGGFYTDTYTLKDFEAGDETFSYRAKVAWDNLAVGDNTYKFIAHFEDGSKESTEITLKFYQGGNYITLDSPLSGANFDTAPIEFKGSVSENADKIVVTASTGDVYQLKDHENGDNEFVYRASIDWGNLAQGQNSYQFDAYFDDGSAKTATVDISFGGYIDFVTTEFDGCGGMSKYAGKSWYSDFTNAVAYLVSQGYDNEVQEMCYSSDDGLVVGLVSGDYCAVGKAFKYETDTKKLSVASFTNVENSGCYGQMTEFGKRSGNIIPITGVLGDAGFAATYYYDYNFVQNKITLKKSYGYNVSEGENSGEWTYY